MLEELRNFIQTDLLNLGDSDALLDDQELLADGMVDSLGMIRLLAFIKETYQYNVPPEDFLIENFSSLNAIVAYLERSKVNS